MSGTGPHPLSPQGMGARMQAHHWTWPYVVVRDTWLSAVESDEAIRMNLKLLGAASIALSIPGLIAGILQVRAGAGDEGWFPTFHVALALFGVLGGILLLLAPRIGWGFVLAAVLGAYVEAALALGHFEQSWFSAVIYAGSMAAEAWVAWFLVHPRTRRLLRLPGSRNVVGAR